MPVTLTVDSNANQKTLRKLEQKGFVLLYAMNMESFLSSGKIKRKDPPLAVIDSPHSQINNSVISGSDTDYPEISVAMTKDNYGDAMQLEGHIRSGRDVFVTDDKDFLNRRDFLEEKFGVEIRSTKEISEMFDPFLDQKIE